MAKIVILSTADMNSAVWTNKQHLATRLSLSHDVSYIESLGLRRIRLRSSDLNRIFARVFNKLSAGANGSKASGSVDIVRPHVVPFHKNTVARALNHVIFRRQIRSRLRGIEQKTILWSFSPVTYGIERYFDSVVYHSVDLIHELDGLPRDLILKSEKEFISQTNRVIASSTVVRDHLLLQGASEVILWENVADIEIFSSAISPRKSRAVFAGNITPGKVDFPLLMSIAETGTELVIAGPTGIDGMKESSEVSELKQYANVTFTGNLDLPELASLLNSCTVGLIPYLQNNYTAGVFPMKVYEYIASGLAVICTELPSLAAIKDNSVYLRSREGFTQTVLDQLPVDSQASMIRKADSFRHSWTSRTRQANDLIQEMLMKL